MDSQTLIYIASALGSLNVVLLSIIAYFAKTSYEEQKVFNKTNAQEHAIINERLAGWSIKLQQIDVNSEDIKQLDKRIDDHDGQIIEIKGKLNTN